MTKPKPPDDPEQSKRFIDMARKIEASETEEGALGAFKRVVSSEKQNPPKENS